MIKSKYITVIGAVLIVVAMVFTMLFATGTISVFEPASANPKYAESLFDTSYVHKINIQVDENDWQNMLANAMNEEYISCNITIDGEVLKNIALRPKGNTSLSSVQGMDSDRYSFKVEFDHYDDGINYKGLDKLVLNNVIQDNSYLKDYLSYRIMQEAGAAAPLCSFAYITVNGADWGLYLAIEAVEESFAKRVYGNDFGQLYKPDSMNMGNRNDDREEGGFGMPGGGMPEFSDDMRAEFEERMKNGGFEIPEGMFRGQMPDNMGEGGFGGQQGMHEGMTPGQRPSGGMGEGGFERPQGMPEGMTPGQRPSGMENGEFGGPQGFPEGMTPPPDMGDLSLNEPKVTQLSTNKQTNTNAELPDRGVQNFFGNNNPFANNNQQNGEEKQQFDRGGFGGFGGFGGGGTSALMYQDDNLESYSVIFNSAVFNPDKADKERVVQALKNLSEGNLENAVDVDGLTKYFAAHNFVVNFDSYTGNMLHNYYLYEEDGKLCMIPWDYNLAFGSFGGMGGRNNGSSVDSATQYVNYPIDTPLSGSSLDQRPMIGKLLQNEEAKAQYHEAFRQLIDGYFKSGDFEREFNRTFEMLAEYVQKDPTKFCTFDEFVKGAETIKEFCLLRAESISGQLDGTIPSTTEGQSANTEALIDASHITISAIGGMGGFGGGPKMSFNSEENVEGKNQEEKATVPAFNETEDANKNQGNRFGEFGGGPMRGFGQQQQPKDYTTNIIVLSASGILLLAGLVFVFAYKKKR